MQKEEARKADLLLLVMLNQLTRRLELIAQRQLEEA